MEDLEIEVQKNGQTVLDDDSVALKRLLRLMQIASNPRLLDSSYTASSGKEQSLDKLIRQICSCGDKCIVWSSFIENIDWFFLK